MSLSHQDVQEILRVLDNSPYDELQLQTGAFTLSLRRDGAGLPWQQEDQSGHGSAASAPGIPLSTVIAAESEPAPTEAGLLDVRAPMVGTFYRAPKPGAEPFVAVGSAVQADTVFAIIEVMKLMSAIPVGVSGEIVEILAEDAQLVEKGQLLLRVRPPRA